MRAGVPGFASSALANQPRTPRLHFYVHAERFAAALAKHVSTGMGDQMSFSGGTTITAATDTTAGRLHRNNMTTVTSSVWSLHEARSPNGWVTVMR